VAPDVPSPYGVKQTRLTRGHELAGCKLTNSLSVVARICTPVGV
jgi:hypothetical protein